jgi:hypothetical protein
MSPDSGSRDLFAERRAEGIIHALRDQDSTKCSDCGETIDLHGANETMEVVAELEAHRQECTGEWFDE